MIMQNSPQDLNAWKTQMKIYEKNKRTKKPFGPNAPRKQIVTYEKIKNEEVRFNPILQNYKSPQDEALRTQNDQFQRAKSLVTHIKQKSKYERPYDIVNLHGMGGDNQSAVTDSENSKKLGPIRNAYNVINNQKLPDFYFKNRDLKLPVDREFTVLAKNQKEYDIVSGVYKENHEQRMKNEVTQEKQKAMEKYMKTHAYDPVFGQFYDAEKEQVYQEELKTRQKTHGQDFDKHLPPSYIMREPFIPDPTKPLPESLRTLDERRISAKKRYQLKYCIEDEYNRRNMEDQQKYEVVIKNKVHNGRVQDEKVKEFDIITMKNYPQDRAEKLFHKEVEKSTWEKLNSTTGKIKSSGFKN